MIDKRIRIVRKGNREICKENYFSIESENDLLYFTFDGLEKTGIVKHCFSSRLGGVSKEHLGTMNLSYTRGDEQENVDENYRRIARVLGCQADDIVCSDQTHTTNVRKVTTKDKGKGLIPDFDSRYFTADFSYGLVIIKQIADMFGIEVKNIDETLEWYHNLVKEKSFFLL